MSKIDCVNSVIEDKTLPLLKLLSLKTKHKIYKKQFIFGD